MKSKRMCNVTVSINNTYDRIQCIRFEINTSQLYRPANVCSYVRVHPHNPTGISYKCLFAIIVHTSAVSQKNQPMAGLYVYVDSPGDNLGIDSCDLMYINVHLVQAVRN